MPTNLPAEYYDAEELYKAAGSPQEKISRLEVYGITITEQIPLKAEPCEHNINYLRTKKYRLGHLLDEDL